LGGALALVVACGDANDSRMVARDPSTADAAVPPSIEAGVTASGAGACADGPAIPRAGTFERIYTPSEGELWPAYINDHSIVRGPDQRWHMFGITQPEPELIVGDERELAHATSPDLTAAMWTKQPNALRADENLGETLLWAPHVIQHDGLYYMFYTGGGKEGSAFQMRLATSPDLQAWTREPEPLFIDGFEARDPFVLRVGERWVMYYTATDDPSGGTHIVAYRTSEDLRNWSERAVAHRDDDTGTGAGPTESPFVVARDGGYYLFIGPYADYVSTAVYFSRDPLLFTGAPVAEIEAHAPEIVRDLDGTEYITRAGWGQGGVFLARLEWTCGAR
jgi:arabinan endo-1,5-alpha-L-arabinosidase